MKKSTALMLLAGLVFALFLITGCNNGNKTTTIKTEPFIGGTTGLKINFVEDAPPDEVYDRGTFPFDVAVLLENVGEYDVNKNDVYVQISGIDPYDFSKTPAFMKKHPAEDLKKTYKNSEGRKIEGTRETVEFNGFNYARNLTGNTQFMIKAEVCYSYETIANAMICIRKDIYGINKKENEEDVCKVSEIKNVYNSGAPVQVENFEEMPRGTSKIGFTFDVSHKGTGDIYKLHSRCNDTTRLKEDYVYVKVNTGMDGLNCSSLSNGTEGFIKLYNGKKTVTCTQEIKNPGDYEKLVKIYLSYDYNEDKTKTILVKHSVD